MTKEQLFIARRKKGITLTEISQYMNCSVSFLSRFERDERNFTAEQFNKYSNYIKKR